MSGSTPRASRGLRPLPVVHVGQPARFALTAPAYAAALVGWTAAAVALATSTTELVGGAVYDARLVLAAHLVGLVFFPFAVTAAVWQLLPVMLRNDPPTAPARPLVLVLVAAGAPLAAGIAFDLGRLAAVATGLVAAGLLLLLVEVATLVRGAPEGKTLVVSRPAVALALAHAALAFLLGAVALWDGGPEPLGIPYERFLLLHLSFAVIGWLTVLIAAVGRTLVPMLGIAKAPERRTVPFPELVLLGGLWLYAAGLALRLNGLVAAGIVVMIGGLAPVARRFLRALGGRIGVREGPVAHAAVGLLLAAQAAAVGLAGALGAVDPRRAAVAAVLLLGLGWGAGVIVGHLGKLASLSLGVVAARAAAEAGGAVSAAGLAGRGGRLRHRAAAARSGSAVRSPEPRGRRRRRARRSGGPRRRRHGRDLPPGARRPGPPALTTWARAAPAGVRRRAARPSSAHPRARG